MATFTFAFLIAFGIVWVVLGCAFWVIRVLLYLTFIVTGKIFHLLRDGMRRMNVSA